MSAANGAGAGPVSNPGAGLRGGLGGVERSGELRSAELVSRLLAATPPYLYNMPLVPHSYFFSEMLRSFVHAKNGTDHARVSSHGVPPAPPSGHRRSRKRSWNQSKISPPLEGAPKQEWPQRPPDIWNNRNTVNIDDRPQPYEEKCPETPVDNDKNQQPFEKPLELTINKNIIPKHISGFKYLEKNETDEKRISPDMEIQSKQRKSPKISDESSSLKEEKYQGNLLTQAGTTHPSLSLPPPPPPLWYPPIYPPPYGIDPLNFFIDLRVSGHIYDRKHGAKEAQNLSSNPSPVPNHQETPHQEFPNVQSRPGIFDNNNAAVFKDSMKSNRHVSAFSVPKPRDANGKVFPMNLCHNGSSKFNMKYYDDMDVKLHERTVVGRNLTSTHYVMQNLKRIYGSVMRNPSEGGDNFVKEERGKMEQEIGDNLDGASDMESSEARKKRRRDLTALIGLELAVDYVKDGKRDSPTKDDDDVISDEERDSSSDVEVLGEQCVD